MKRTRTIVIVKRDGTLERFSLPKLRSCLARVMQLSAGSAELADPLARAVGLHLRECRPDDMPASEYLYRCARSVLRQTGLADAARLLAAHRRLREARRRRVRVFDPLDLEQRPLRWRKGTLVATLQNIYDLRQSVARFLAGRIEEQVFGLGVGVMIPAINAK